MDILLYLAFLKLFRLAGWVAGWLVGKSDFNENPVVSPDLDLDFGLRLRVCQFQHGDWGLEVGIGDWGLGG